MLDRSGKHLNCHDEHVRGMLLPHCRLRPGEIWHDPAGKHLVACGDAADSAFIAELLAQTGPATLAVHDPPYNQIAFGRQPVDDYIAWCRQWISNTEDFLGSDSSLYVWLGADQNRHFQPLPQFMLMMAETDFATRSFITMRNQRGYGTPKNYMAVRQELLYYTRGKPGFQVQYTDIPKILRGYYKPVGGQLTENLQRSRAETLRASNVWVDVQQVFYRMEENVNGCYAQKPLKAIERIVSASSREGERVLDFFAHAGTTLLACERTGRRCVTLDIDPVFAEITIRRLEHFRRTGRTGWQRGHPFELELAARDDVSVDHPISAAT